MKAFPQTRRAVLGQAAASGVMMFGSVEAAERSPLFDSHIHVTSDDLSRYPPNPVDGELKPGQLDNPLTAERLISAMNTLGIARAVLVQRIHVYGFDNRYVLDSCAAFPNRFIPVCSLDGRVPGGGQALRDLARSRRLAGVRFTESIKGMGLGWLSGDNALEIWKAAADLHLPVVVHLFRWNRLEGLAAVSAMLARFPDLKVVLDHASNLSVEQGRPDFGYDAALKAVMTSPRVSLKVSVINLNAAVAGGVNPSELIAALVRMAGPGRVMWGSDAGNTPGRLDDFTARGVAATSLLAPPEQVSFLRGTANAVFGS